MQTLWLVIGGSVALAGVALLLAGARGRRVNDHPLCRGCGFDLSGLREPERCPECGRGLAGARAVRIGARRRTGGAIVLGLVLLSAGSAWTGTVVYVRASGLDLNTIKPAWLLAREAAAGDTARASAAIAELTARLDADRLSVREIDGLIEAVLRRQADTGREWTPEAGRVVERLIMEEYATNAQAERYLEKAYGVELVTRDVFVEGEPVLPLLQLELGRGDTVASPFAMSLLTNLGIHRDMPSLYGGVSRHPYRGNPGGPLPAPPRSSMGTGIVGIYPDRFPRDDEGRLVLKVDYLLRVLRPQAVEAHRSWTREALPDGLRDLVLFERRGTLSRRLASSSLEEVVGIVEDTEARDRHVSSIRMLRGVPSVIAGNYDFVAVVGPLEYGIGYEVFVLREGGWPASRKLIQSL